MSNNYTKEENKNINDKPINSQNILLKLLKYNKNTVIKDNLKYTAYVREKSFSVLLISLNFYLAK